MIEHSDIRLWNFIHERLNSGERVALLIVCAETKGSPGKRGFKMALTDARTCVGTIGGGVMEHSLIQQYATRLERAESFRELRLLVHAEQTKRGEPSGLTCAGSQTVCALSLDVGDIPVAAAIVDALKHHTQAAMIVDQDGLHARSERPAAHASFTQASESEWSFSETVGPEYTMLIVGGGHVGLALSRVMSTLSMHVVVYDERAEMPIFAENPYADRTIADAYANLRAHVAHPARTFAAVVTSDYSTDAVAVGQLVGLGLPYLGIMGVQAKMARIKASLGEAERGLFESPTVHAPIGVPINSSTAEEIAVSIAAEIIAVRHSLEREQT